MLADPGGAAVLDEPAASSLGAVRAAGALLLGLGALDVVLGLATFVGHNWARVALMLGSAFAISLTFLNAVGTGPVPTLSSGLPVAALSVLVLLALTSPASRSYAGRGAREAPEAQRSEERSPGSDDRPSAGSATGPRR